MATTAEEVLVHLLKTDTAVRARVGEGKEFRIHPDLLPSKWRGKASVVYEQTGDSRQRLLNGDETGLVRSRFRLYCVGRTRAETRDLAGVARDALHNFIGDVDLGNGTTVTVRQVFVPDGEQDESVPSDDGDERPERSRTIEAIVHYCKPTPQES